MPTIEEILRAAKEAGASDVHLTVGIPPKMRVNGNLITMDYPKMLPADTLEVLVNIMTEVQRERFENGENMICRSLFRTVDVIVSMRINRGDLLPWHSVWWEPRYLHRKNWEYRNR